MRIAEQARGQAGKAERTPLSAPMPFAPPLDELPGVNADVPIEPPPPTTRRILKARLHHRGHSRPIPITDPWE